MTRCTCGCLSPFRFAEFPRPSIFMREPTFRSVGGKTQSQIASESADASLIKYGRSNALSWIAKPGPVADPRALAVTNNRRKA